MGSKFLRFLFVLTFLCFDAKDVFALVCTSAEINSCSSWKCNMAGRRYCQTHGCDQYGAEFCDSICNGDRSTTAGNLSCSISADEKANDLCVTISGNKCTVTGMDFYNTQCSYSGEVTCPTAPGGVNVVQVPCSVDSNRKVGLTCGNTGSCPDPKGYNEALDSSPSSGCTWCEAGLKVAYNGSVYKCCNDGDTLPSGSNPNCSSFCPAGGFDIDVPLGQHNPSSASGDCACKSGLVTKYDGSDYMCCGPDQTMSGKVCVCAAGYTKSGSSCISNCTVGSWTNTSEFEIQSEVCKMKQTRSVCGSERPDQWIAATDSNACCSSGTHWGGSSCVADCVADSNWTLQTEFKIESSSCKQKRTKKTCPSGATGASSTATEWVNASNPDSCCSSTEAWGGSSCVPRITCGGDYVKDTNNNCHAQCKNLKQNEVCFTEKGISLNKSKNFVLDPKIAFSDNPSISECFKSGAVRYKPSSNVAKDKFNPDSGRRFTMECMLMVPFDDLNEHIPD